MSRTKRYSRRQTATNRVRRVKRVRRLLSAAGIVAAAIVVIVVALSRGSAHRSPATAVNDYRGQHLALRHGGGSGPLPAGESSARIGSRIRTRLPPRPLSPNKAVGQLLIGTYAGEQPPTSILDAVRAGQLGAVILMGGNTAAGVAATRAATNELQAAARAGEIRVC